MNPTRRITREELDELAEAFNATRAWRQQSTGVYTTSANDWTFVVNYIDELNCSAIAHNSIRNVEVQLSSNVTKVWYQTIITRHAN